MLPLHHGREHTIVASTCLKYSSAADRVKGDRYYLVAL